MQCLQCTFIWAVGDQSPGPAFVSKYIRILIKGLYQAGSLSRRTGPDLRAAAAGSGSSHRQKLDEKLKQLDFPPHCGYHSCKEAAAAGGS